MKIRLIVIIILIGLTVAVYAQVNRPELDNLPPVAFINYEGPHAVVNTREEIRQIGVALGNVIAERERGIAPTLAAMAQEERRAYSYRFDAGPLNRYFVIHSVSGNEDGKLDADIMGLGVDTLVDHVRNLRTIIQGYLQSAYGYNESDARLLAEFITIYNAVYRGNWDYLTGRYKTPVMDHLTRERAGLSIRFDEWPGRTQMLIPLGTVTAIDAGVISDSRVIDELRRDDDQGIPQRQQIVELLEREATQADRQAQTQQQAIRQEERQIAEERQQVQQERQQVQQERQQVQQDQQAGVITAEEARQQQQDLDRREETVQQREDEIERREDALDERREEAQRLAEFAETRTEQALQQREEIARDQQVAIIQQLPAGIIGISIEKTTPTAMGRIVFLDPANAREIRRSPMNVIHTRTVTFIGGRILAIAGESVGQGAVRLIELNSNNLEMARQGDDDIRTGSLLWVNGNDLYAITTSLSSNQCYIGRFNTNLELQARSIVNVHPDAGITIQQGRLLTQRENGSVLALNPADLTEIR